MNILVLCPMLRECNNMNDALSKFQVLGRSLKNNYKVVHCGVGKVNAAAAASLEIGSDPSKYDLIVDVGYAAGSSYFMQGDFVLPSSARYHDCVVPVGCVPEMDCDYPLEGSDPVVILTGDTFVDSKVSSDLVIRFGRKVIFDMEATAIAQVSSEYNIPTLVLKIISDIPGSGSTVQSFEEFVDSHTDFSQFVNYLEHLV